MKDETVPKSLSSLTPEPDEQFREFKQMHEQALARIKNDNAPVDAILDAAILYREHERAPAALAYYLDGKYRNAAHFAADAWSHKHHYCRDAWGLYTRDMFINCGQHVPQPKLSRKVTVYRGQLDDWYLGWSWTLNKPTAEFFIGDYLKRYGLGGHPGRVLSMTVLRDEILFAFDNEDHRPEHEVILDPEMYEYDMWP